MEVKYDKIGAGYNLTRKADTYLIEQLLYHLKPTKNGMYLDIGCGTGNYTDELQKKGFRFIGIDPSKQMLEKAKLRNNKIDWKIGTAENIGLPENRDFYLHTKTNGRLLVESLFPKNVIGLNNSNAKFRKDENGNERWRDRVLGNS